ncbi:MAG: glycosyltransferase family 2 protein [Candidatus Hodarchaeota archaeon]
MTITQEIVKIESIAGKRIKKEKKPSITVLIPAYNEENGIASLISRTREILSTIAENSKILVVDDGSSDKTREILEVLEVERFFHRKNLGKGDVIRNALQFVENEDIIVTMDGDGEHDPNDMNKLVTPLLKGRANIVIGSRFLVKKSRKNEYLKRNKKEKFIKKFGNWLFTFLLWIFTRRIIKDTQSGYRAFRARNIQELNLCSSGFRIEMEMTIKAIKNGYIVREVPIKNGNPNRFSHLNAITDGARIVLTIFRECLPKWLNKPFDWVLPRIPEKIGRLLG